MAAFLSDCFVNRRIVVVGCAQGHGFSIAEGCAANGAELLLIDRNPALSAAAQALSSANHNVSHQFADATQPSELKSAIDELAAEKAIDGLIYLPRARVRKPFDEVTSEDWDADLDVALKGAFLSAQATIPHLKRSSRNPFILTLSSILSGYVGNESVGYHAAKGGLESLTRYLAVQLGPVGIRVNAIQMGWIIKDQDMPRFSSPENANYRTGAINAHPLRRIGTADDLVNSVLFLASERASFITGQVLCLDGGLTLQEHTHFLNRMTSAR